MPRYHLHIRDVTGRMTDDEGLDLPDLEAARAEALESARLILADRVRRGHPIGRQSFEIADENGTVLLNVPMRAVLDLS